MMDDDDFEDLFGDEILADDQAVESLNVAPPPIETHLESTCMDYEMECSYVPPSYSTQETVKIDSNTDRGDHKPQDSPLLTVASSQPPVTKATAR